MNRNGKFIVLEGGEGAGKGVVMEDLRRRLVGRDDVIFTREPGGTPMAEKIRELVLSKGNDGILPITELFLFCAARAQHVSELIKPALDADKIVICDRFEDSTKAYQIFGRQQPDLLRYFNELNETAKQGIKPDVVIYLDVEPEVGLERKAKSKDGHCTRFDAEKLDFHKRVRAGYLQLFKQKTNKKFQISDWYCVETTKMSEQEVKEAVWNVIKKNLR